MLDTLEMVNVFLQVWIIYHGTVFKDGVDWSVT